MIGRRLDSCLSNLKSPVDAPTVNEVSVPQKLSMPFDGIVSPCNNKEQLRAFATTTRGTTVATRVGPSATTQIANLAPPRSNGTGPQGRRVGQPNGSTRPSRDTTNDCDAFSHVYGRRLFRDALVEVLPFFERQRRIRRRLGRTKTAYMYRDPVLSLSVKASPSCSSF